MIPQYCWCINAIRSVDRPASSAKADKEVELCQSPFCLNHEGGGVTEIHQMFLFVHNVHCYCLIFLLYQQKHVHIYIYIYIYIYIAQLHNKSPYIFHCPCTLFSLIIACAKFIKYQKFNIIQNNGFLCGAMCVVGIMW